MNASEIIIGYEDRLRLSELSGQLADAQWIVDNPIVANAPFTILLFIVLTLLAIPAWAVLSDTFSRSWKHDCICMVVCALGVIGLIVVCFFVLCEYQAHDVEVIQAQIDEIRRMWGIEGLVP